MLTSTLTIAGDIGGVAFNSNVSKSAVGQIGHLFDLPAAAAGTLSTRTSDTAGVLTLAEEHGIETDDTIDIYWDGGRRYNVTADLVDGNDVTFSGGAGDVLPTEDDPVTAQTQKVFDTDFDADLLEIIGAMLGAAGHMSFYESGDVLALPLDLAAGALWLWIKDGIVANPLAGKVIDYIVVTQAGSSAEATFRCGLLYDSTE